MKRIAAVLLLIIVVMTAAGCGAVKKPVEVEITAPVSAQTPAQTTAPAAAETVPESSLKETAEGFIEKDVSELIKAVGKPKSSDYAKSCAGAGDDGELIYDGFTVYTYREGDREIVKEVI